MMISSFVSIRSIRTKLVGLVAVIALIVGVASAIYSSTSSRNVLEDQVAKRGHYIASNLAYNSKYGVLTEDRPLLSQYLEGAFSAGTDVVGAMIRDINGRFTTSDRNMYLALLDPEGSIEPTYRCFLRAVMVSQAQ